MGDVWTLDSTAGELLLHTGVAGRAASMGHRLTIAMTRWRATVRWAGAEPIAAELAVEVNSLEVLRGEGGIKGLSGPEKGLVRANALRSLDAGRYPDIRFVAAAIDKAADGYRLSGTLHIRAASREHVIDLRTDDVGDSWRMTAQSTVKQSDYGVKPYSLMMGSLRVTDDVDVSFTAVHVKDN
ncbi:YceI family protein [Mycobacterium angelicum]|uniref:S-adenosyl-L-methionine-dependent methyltransferase n=1 Tax=Mycobacterium angelicum TaxID=470074 RepID=A0A1W9ZBY3_MYCAN|nr:YceI family protein [Mycobacterium angelicum]MCV7195144.1 YceI family protein [Mycobacterium angelicum]ORA11529.1 S-adenosyl-L-methionine-dependent methyltransferase [Mycobacterium angelicum]